MRVTLNVKSYTHHYSSCPWTWSERFTRKKWSWFYENILFRYEIQQFRICVPNIVLNF